MSNSEEGRLTLTSATPGVQLTVLNSGLQPVTSTSNWYRQSVTAGVYLVEGRVGSATTKRLITIRPGFDETQDLSVDFATAAPIRSQQATSEDSGRLARNLSWELTDSGGPDAGIVLVLRNLGGLESGHLRTGDLELLDSQFNPVSEWNSDWVDGDETDEAAGRTGRLKPGPYVLRTTRYSPAEPERAAERVDQTIWLSPGWQTLVFVPNTSQGPDPRGLSVQMTNLSRVWQPDDWEGAAAEAALAGLRDGTDAVDESTTDMLLHGKFRNPMLGILGLHTLMLRRSPDPELVETVVGNLERLVGAHPDVMALAATVPRRGLDGIQVSWPPMLERSYRICLLSAGQGRPDVLPADSPAQRIAPLIRIPGPWLRWTAAKDIRQAAAGLYDELENSNEYIVATDDGDGSAGGPAPHPALPRYTNRRQLASGAAAAVGSVERAVFEIASFRHGSPHEAVSAIGVTELARRTGLPEQLVANSIQVLGFDRPS